MLNVRFHLSVKSRSSPASGFAVLELKPAPPQPSNGSCVVIVEGNVSPVVALIDQVKVSCSDWQDHSDTSSLLEYYVFVNDSTDHGCKSVFYDFLKVLFF